MAVSASSSRVASRPYNDHWRTYSEAAEETLVRAEAGHLHQPGLLQAQEGPPLLLVGAASSLHRFLLLLLLLLLVLPLAPPLDHQPRGRRIPRCNRTFSQSGKRLVTR